MPTTEDEFRAAVDPTMKRARSDWLRSYGEGGANRAAVLRNIASLRPEWSPSQSSDFFLSQLYPSIDKTIRNIQVRPSEFGDEHPDYHSSGPSPYIGHKPRMRERRVTSLNPLVGTTPLGYNSEFRRWDGSDRYEGRPEGLAEWAGAPRYIWEETLRDYPYRTAMHEVGHGVDQSMQEALGGLAWYGGNRPARIEHLRDLDQGLLASELIQRNENALLKAFPFAGSWEGSGESSGGFSPLLHELQAPELMNAFRTFRATMGREPTKEDIRSMLRGKNPVGEGGTFGAEDIGRHHWQQGGQPDPMYPLLAPKKRREYEGMLHKSDPRLPTGTKMREGGRYTPGGTKTRLKPATVEDILKGFMEFSEAPSALRRAGTRTA